MTENRKNNPPPYLETLHQIINDVIEPNALNVDQNGTFPRANMEALGEGGFLGLISAKEIGGMGCGPRDMVLVTKEVAKACGSTAMVLCMHYCALAILENYASDEVRKMVISNNHISTLALSEYGSRSHFWMPVSTATAVDNNNIKLYARKSWATSAGEADSYVWSSRPVEVEGEATLWFVPSNATGLSIPKPFDGLGLRGNSSSPVTADGVIVDKSAMLGKDGQGFEIMMNIANPYFLAISAAVSVGFMETATTKAANHIKGTKFNYTNQPLTELPTIRAYLARMRIKTDMAWALLLDTITAWETNREDMLLRLLEVKAASAELATEVTDLAMRVCGGTAFRKDIGIERHFRDARASTVMSPTTDLLYDFIGRVMCEMPLL